MAAPRTDLLNTVDGMELTASLENGHLAAGTTTSDVGTGVRPERREEGTTGATMRFEARRAAEMKEGKKGRRFEKELTVCLECVGKELGPMVLLRAATNICGTVLAYRQINRLKYELTVSNPQAKGRLLDGFRVGETVVHGRDITTDELVVSFLGLPAYIEDEEIVAKLLAWGVSAVTDVRRRMWPGTDVADGTRFVRVRFTDTVQSLPYSVRFNTAAGPEYFRVIHDRQVRVCRGCLQPGHVLRDCPDFLCRNCGGQGHYARECNEPRAPKCRECRMFAHLCPCRDEELADREERASAGGASGCAAREAAPPALATPIPVVSVEGVDVARNEEAPVRGGETGVDARPTLDQGEGVSDDPSPKAGAAGVVPGRRVGEEVAPRLTSEAGVPAPGADRFPKPAAKDRGRDSSRLPQRKRSRSRRDSAAASVAAGQLARAPDGQAGGGASQAPVPEGTAFSPPGCAAFVLTDIETGDMMVFGSAEVKKRQIEGVGPGDQPKKSK